MASIPRTDAENKLSDVTIGKYSLEEDDSSAVKNTSNVHFNRAFSQFKKIYDLFEHANRVLQRGSISNSLIGYISLDEHAHESHHHWFLIELVDDLFRTHSFPVNCLPGIDGSSSNHLPLWNINSDRCLTVDTLRPNTIRSKLSVFFFFFFIFFSWLVRSSNDVYGDLGWEKNRRDITIWRYDSFLGFIFRYIVAWFRLCSPREFTLRLAIRFTPQFLIWKRI